ncbi:MAG: hypothetical protein PVJ73_15770 [Acidobacteriota bacterium]|jgi:hypothetical protein
MKKLTYRVVPLVFVLTLAGLLVPCAAQDSEVLTAEIPFDFIVDGTTLPAGNYKVEVAPGPGEPPILAIQTTYESGDKLQFRKVIVSTTPLKEAEGNPRLVFKQVGDLHFLEKVVPLVGDVKEVR